ncbi:Sodium-independent sulfate anion transporter [Apis cerana cerana]|uniref:Sodium-independent sulfate anion transporter n=1 Tax=Apis cerana cerana TaxID=94128 RepID=A0A2A3E470_APICC|nr:Sodium-independent sulfate anion transporter [Apis cerana cerana]
MSYNRGSIGEQTPLLRRNVTSGFNLRQLLLRRIPILAWIPQYSSSKLLQDILAGLTVGLTAIPQGIAYAIVAGLPAQYGLYSSFMGCFVYLVFGSCKDITVGPTAIMALLSQHHVIRLGEDIAVLLCFLTGCVIFLMGLLHLGFLVEFVSMPVISGFTNAAAIIIGTSQLGTLLGLSGRSDSFIDAIAKVVNHFDKITFWDPLLGFCSMILLVCLKKLPGKKTGTVSEKFMWVTSLARNAVVVIFGIILNYSLFSYGIKIFKSTGNITEGLPPFAPPPFSLVKGNHTYNFEELIGELGSTVISVPLIAILESIAIAKAFARTLIICPAKGKTVDANQEMLALGLCNIFGSFSRSMPTTGSFTRTAVNNASGVKTPMGGLITGCLVLLACGLLTSTFEFIPKATLAAVIIVAMCDTRPGRIPVVVEGRHVLRIDATVAKNLALLLADLEARDQRLVFWNWCEEAKRTLTSYDASLHASFRSSGSVGQIFSPRNAPRE